MVDLRERRVILSQGDKMRLLQDCPCLTKKDVCKEYANIGSNRCLRKGGVCKEYKEWVSKYI